MTAPRGPILLSILLPMIGTAHAQDRPIGFLTPSKNIACQFFTDNGQGVLRCDIMNMDARPRRPMPAYGEALQRGGLTCRSEQTGLTCFNAMQRGFSLGMRNAPPSSSPVISPPDRQRSFYETSTL